MCQACFEGDAMFCDYLLRRPGERVKLTAAEAGYYGFRRDAATGQWVDAWDEPGHLRAESVALRDASEPATR